MGEVCKDEGDVQDVGYHVQPVPQFLEVIASPLVELEYLKDNEVSSAETNHDDEELMETLPLARDGLVADQVFMVSVVDEGDVEAIEEDVEGEGDQLQGEDPQVVLLPQE